GPRPRHRLALVFTSIHIFDRQDFGPIFPVLIADQNGYWRTNGMRMTHAGHNLRPVGFDLHASAAAVALLPAPQLPIDGFQRNGYSGREPVDSRNQAF